MTSNQHWRILSTLLRTRFDAPRSYLIAPTMRLNNCQLVVKAPQLVQVASASLDDTWEYCIDDDNAVIQTSRLASARASPNSFVGVQLVGTFSALIDARDIFPVFEATASLHPQPHLSCCLLPISQS